MNGMPGPGPADAARVAVCVSELKKFTGHVHLESRTREIDGRIAAAGLSLADKISLLKALSPSAEEQEGGAATLENAELRMERLLLSIAPEDLPAFKFALEYDLDYKDPEEYVFHDIDDADRQDRLVAHLRRTPSSGGIKVLSDVDDTMYANLIERRYPKGTFYPGVLDFYDAAKEEPFGALPAIPITTLSARPNPVAGKLEEASLKKLVALTKNRLCPSALSGSIGSSTVGTVESLLRAHRARRPTEVEPGAGADDDALSDRQLHGEEDKIGDVKFANFARFAAIYPEYRYVFVGDSGQADALTASRMITETSTEGTARVVTTFIHDLRQSERDTAAASQAFRNLASGLVVGRDSPTGRGVIVFKNYIEAALIAYRHAATLQHLITAEKLARITQAALVEFRTIALPDTEASRELRGQYRQHAEETFTLLTAAAPTAGVAAAAKDIRQILDSGFTGR
ncbi:MAG TPA: hypothetical protein VK548_19925 [Candidatus Acidoferrum sp.]|nr:hypothetical protein [Candidatus Acidoferrum sp.]